MLTTAYTKKAAPYHKFTCGNYLLLYLYVCSVVAVYKQAQKTPISFTKPGGYFLLLLLFHNPLDIVQLLLHQF